MDTAVDDFGELLVGDFQRWLAVGAEDGAYAAGAAFLGNAAAVVDLQLLGGVLRDVAHAGDVLGDDGAGERNHLAEFRPTVLEDDHIGGAAADVDQGDAALLLVLGEAGEAGGDGLKNEFPGLDVRRGDTGVNLLDFLYITCYNLVKAGDFGANFPDGVEGFVAGAVGGILNHVFLRDDGDNPLVGREGDILDIVLHLVEFLLGDQRVVVGAEYVVLAVAGADVARGDAGVNAVDFFHPGMAGGELHGSADALLCFQQVLDEAVLDTFRRGLAVPEDFDFALVVQIADDGGHLGCANVETDHDVARHIVECQIAVRVVFIHTHGLFSCCYNSVLVAGVELGVGVVALV